MSPTAHRSRRLWAVLGVVVAMLTTLGAGLAVAGTVRSAPAGCDTVRLIVKSRAGLLRATRDRLFARSDIRRRAQIPHIGATIVEIPRASLRRVTAALRTSSAFSSVEEDAVATATEVPNDPLFFSQWGAIRINSPAAWNVSSGSPDILVAVLDTGVDATHPDLDGQLVPGHDFVNDDDDPSDDNGHGTAMTGIVAAKANNLIGLVGIASASKVLPVKVLDANGNGLYSTIATGIIYAADHGVRVINLSLAGPSSSAVLQSAVDYARAHDVIVVAAAGNDGQNTPMYPAALDGVVAVAATDQSERSTGFSNYGAWVALSAPGVSILTTKPGAAYAGATGTSPATAMTSGAFALLLAANPTMTGPDAVGRMTANAVDLGSTGWDPHFGYGRLDAYAALAPGPIVQPVPDTTRPVASIFSPSKESLVYGIVPVDVHATDNIGVARVDLEVDRRPYASVTSAPYAFAWDTSGVKQGSHRLRAFAYDASGNVTRTAEIRVYVTPGVGLLVQRASFGPSRVPGADALSINAVFALSNGVVFDPATEAVTVDLASGRGPVLSLTIPPGALLATRRGVLQFTRSATPPASGTLTVKIAKGTSGNAYSLNLSGTTPALTNMDAILNLQVAVGAQVLTQSITLRPWRAKLLLP